jgi:hypothetical protein
MISQVQGGFSEPLEVTTCPTSKRMHGKIHGEIWHLTMKNGDFIMI